MKEIQEERLRQLAVSETGFVFDPQTGQSFTVNSTGQAVLALLKKESSLTKIAEQLTEDFDTSAENALAGIEAFVRQLGRYL